MDKSQLSWIDRKKIFLKRKIRTCDICMGTSEIISMGSLTYIFASGSIKHRYVFAAAVGFLGLRTVAHALKEESTKQIYTLDKIKVDHIDDEKNEK